MRNQIVSDLLYHSLFEEEIKMEEEPEDELEHHGVKDMSWGERNGPPYPLRGIDKKIARAQYRKEREQKKRLKKLQKAAKKARKLKKKEERTQEQIRKKKQQLVKKGNMEEIRKNADLFTNEELEYIVDRDNKKRSLKSNQERDKDEKIELFMKRFGQFASIAADSQKVLTAVKMGAEIVGQVKANKVKDIEAEQKQWDRYSKEFDARNKLDPEDAKGYLEFITGGASYKQDTKQSKEDKKVASLQKKAENAEKIKEYQNRINAVYGESKKTDKTTKRDEKVKNEPPKSDVNKTTGALEIKELKKDVNDKGKSFLLDEKDGLREKRAQWELRKLDKKIWNAAYENIFAQDDAKRQYGGVADQWVPKKNEIKTSYNAGKDWSSAFFSSDWKGQTYQAQKGYQVTPQKKIINFNAASEPSPISEAKNTSKYTLSDRNKWSSKPVTSMTDESSNSVGKKYMLSDRNKWSQKPVNSLKKELEGEKTELLKEIKKLKADVQLSRAEAEWALHEAEYESKRRKAADIARNKVADDYLNKIYSDAARYDETISPKDAEWYRRMAKEKGEKAALEILEGKRFFDEFLR